MQTDKNILVSVIVPVYNVSKYLCRCLDSCVFQTLEDIEIIVINDGSSDKDDSAIMESYKENYPEKIRLVYNSENQGLGSARNTGIKLARGKYVMFVDSDDYVDVTICQKCYECAEKENSEIVLTGFYNCRIGGKILFKDRKDSVKSKKFNVYAAWAMLIKKELVERSDVWFPARLYHEDTAVTPLWQAIAHKISFVKEPLYYYIKGRPTSITSLKFEDRIVSMFKAYDWLFENTSRFPQHFDMMIFHFFQYFSSYLIEIKNTSIFRTFASCFSEIYKKYDLNMQSLSMKGKQIFELFLHTSAGQDWDNAYSEYLHLTDKQYLITYTRDGLKELLCGREPETVCVWGCGNFGTEFLTKLGEIGYKCLATDMDVTKFGSVMPNGSVVQPWKEIKDNVKTLIVGVAGKFEEISNLVNSDVEVFAVNG